MTPAVEAKPSPATELPQSRASTDPSSNVGPDFVFVSEGESDDDDNEAKARVGVPQDEPKAEDLDSDLYYNQEEEDVDTGSFSSASKGEVYKNLLSEFDDFVANEKNGALVGACRALSYGFEVGDMVWGKVKSHPWWPGHIFNEGFASSSVRRTRREGHVLVAFFGDSSYGWFDPAELVLFEDNFEEKSQQTNSRNFVKAVEEAVDEASRRSGLGVVCRCRNPYNFRPTDVEGYFAVDVPDFEPGGVYSEKQIRKSREEFRPAVTLEFVKRLAAAPIECDVNTMEFFKYKATASAFRKAVFEEFDETYAQAFGVQPSRPYKSAANSSDQPARAPLSGPLVIAETLGGEKSSKKAIKVKDHSKKDKYVLKKRDDPIDGNVVQVGQKHAHASPQMAYAEGSPAVVGDYVLQKRPPASYIATSDGHTGSASEEKVGTDEDEYGQPAAIDNQDATQGAVLDTKQSVDEEKGSFKEFKQKNESGSDVVVGPQSTGLSDLSGKGTVFSCQQDSEMAVNCGSDEKVKTSTLNEGSQQAELSVSAKAGDTGFNKLQDSHVGSHVSLLNVKCSVGMTTDGRVKKSKNLKHPLGDSGSENSTMGEKKKKRKKELGSETNSDRPKKHSAAGQGGAVTGNSTGKVIRMGLASRDDSQINHQKKDSSSSNSSLNYTGTSLPLVGMGNVEVELPKLLRDLHDLALEPFHCVQRMNTSTAMQFFLRFRSLVYQKSLVLSPPSESEQVEVPARKPSRNAGASNKAGRLKDRESTPSKPVRPDDPAKLGKKRMRSDRQEEIAAKRLKKLKQLKSLVEEKKASQKSLEPPQAEGKEPATIAPQRPVKPVVVRKMATPARIIEPTMLVMKFPPDTALPSGAELKAKFARFGSIDQSAIRVFWKSSTCRVVFRHKRDAVAAHKYAIANSTLFGNMDVRYSLREVGAPEAPESGKVRGDDTPAEAPRAKDFLTERPALALGHQPFAQSGQLKSILKKPSGDEAGQVTGGNGGRGTRVKFMLGGEESTSRGEQLMVGNRNNFNNSASYADDGGAPTSVAMDFSSKNIQKVLPPFPLPPLLPLPSQIAKPQLNNPHHYSEVAPRNMHNLNTRSAAPVASTMDISQQMLSLLTRCNDVVTRVTGLLGYVPYHPL